MSDLRHQWHESPRYVAAGQTVPGRIVILIIATALMVWHQTSALVPITLVLVMLLPARRRQIVGIAAFGAIVEYFAARGGVTPGSMLAEPALLLRPLVLIVGVVVGLYVFYRLTLLFARWPTPMRRYPLLSLHAGFWAGLALMRPLPVLGVLAEIGPWLIWRLSYLVQLASRGGVQDTRFTDHALYLWPVFGGTSTPYGKGLDYLRRCEASDAAANSRSQLAGLKLLMLAVAWHYAVLLMDMFVFGAAAGFPDALSGYLPDGSLRVPHLGDVIAGATVAVGVAWASLYLELIYATLRLAVAGHIIIGCLRLLGFNVFRNTYKPLLAESIIEFWNRYYYYFKELLVEFFFYPVFLRGGRLGPQLRLFVSVFAAAFVGNMYYHLILDPNLIVAGDPGVIWARWGARLVYCFILALGIYVSMRRQQRTRRTRVATNWPGRLRRIAGVWTFYAVIHVWNVDASDATFSDRGNFCLRLLGLG